MLKTVPGILFFCCLYLTMPAMAQNADSLKRVDSLKRIEIQKRADSLKIDTNMLNRYRIDPRHNSIPIRSRPQSFREEQLPVALLDYKINYWRKWVNININLNQTSFSSNWSNGGVSSLAIGGNFEYKTEYNKAPFDYTSQLLMVYGRLSNKGQIARKTNDRLFFDNKISTRISKMWGFFGSVTLETQFDKGYNYPNNALPVLISSMFSPGYVTESIGFEYKPNNIFNLRIGTGTARQTIVLDTAIYHGQPNNYAVERGKKVKNELAFQLVAHYEKDIMQNMHLSANYLAFLPYGRGFGDNIDHRLDAKLDARVNKLIVVGITATVLFDKDQQPKPQYTEGLAMGVTYRFP